MEVLPWVSGHLELELMDSCELPRGNWVLNLDPLEQQSVLLTTESSLQSYNERFLWFHCVPWFKVWYTLTLCCFLFPRMSLIPSLPYPPCVWCPPGSHLAAIQVSKLTVACIKGLVLLIVFGIHWQSWNVCPVN